MVNFSKFKLDNGLTVIHHEDKSTPFAGINILYNVGSKHEDENRTGFAHLFEHLMFGGSANIPDYDTPLQNAGGENNAFTSNDYTNYYLTLPKENIETGFWLESDRMLELGFNTKSLDTQKQVVSEEFRQRYFNQPYGDICLYLRPLAYKQHPYQWPTIGKSIEHIEDAKMEDVKEFFYKHYAPNNAIMCVTGNIEFDEVKRLSQKWFANIPKRELGCQSLPQEPQQEKSEFLELERNVPMDALYKAYHMCGRKDKDYYATDLLSDILSNGNSSRLYQKLVKEKQVFQSIDAYITGDVDPGLFVFSGKVSEGVNIEDAERELQKEIELIKVKEADPYELQKVKNKTESTIIYSEVNYMNKALNLCFYELIGDASIINNDVQEYLAVTLNDIHRIANNIFKDTNCTTVYCRKKQN